MTTESLERMSDAVCVDTPPRAALTYAERLMLAAFDSGMLAGLSASRDRSAVGNARRAYAEYRKARGYATHAEMLTRPESQPKLGKGERYALGLMLTPARDSRDPSTRARVRLADASPHVSRLAGTAHSRRRRRRGKCGTGSYCQTRTRQACLLVPRHCAPCASTGPTT
jgi:hypothetical protein